MSTARSSRLLLGAALLAAVLGVMAPPPVSAQAATPGVCATVEVLNVRPAQGHLMLAAYADAASFMKTPVVALRLAAAEATMNFQLCGLSGDAVALALFQDLDGDGKMGSNRVGMPTEPWGASGVPGAFGPTWLTARVALDGRTITVRLSQ